MTTGARRRKILAAFWSGIVPGLGQLYNRQPVKAAMFLVPSIILSWRLGRSVPADPMALLSAPIGSDVVGLLCLLLAIWIWSVIDAWLIAGR